MFCVQFTTAEKSQSESSKRVYLPAADKPDAKCAHVCSSVPFHNIPTVFILLLNFVCRFCRN